MGPPIPFAKSPAPPLDNTARLHWSSTMGGTFCRILLRASRSYLLPLQAAPQFSSDVKTCYVLRLIVARVQIEQSHSLRSDRTSHQVCSMSFWVRGPSLSTETPGIQGICPIGRTNFSCGIGAARGDASNSVEVAVRPDLLEDGD